jgi:phosphoribosyl 1,2-cyclic phosphate phosphodiesterase
VPDHAFHPLHIRVLGSGTSMGVPVIGCTCAVCVSTDTRNKRLRSSIMIEAAGRHVLVDCSIDFRQQMLAWPAPRIEAILLTHTHSDHVGGLDDLRVFNYRQAAAIPIYSTAAALEDLRRRFAYCFDPVQKGGGVPQLELRPVKPGVEFHAAGLRVLPIEIMHGVLPILGFRLGAFAYLTDCSAIPESSEPMLQGLDVLIVSALRRRPHSTHFNLDQALDAARRLKVRRVFFTHMADEMDHEATNRDLPDWARLLYDGQLIESR